MRVTEEQLGEIEADLRTLITNAVMKLTKFRHSGSEELFISVGRLQGFLIALHHLGLEEWGTAIVENVTESEPRMKVKPKAQQMMRAYLPGSKRVAEEGGYN